MKISSTGCVFLLIFISVTIVLGVPPGGEVEDEMEFNYVTNGPKGPENWGTLKPEWKLCGIGQMQSPINLTDENVQVSNTLGSLRSQYLPANATIKNRGHDIMLEFEGGNKGIGITICGINYQLQQIHWHTPCEHSINGERYALEEHMVHQSKSGRYAVVAFLYDIGEPDPLLLSLEEHLKKITDTYKAEDYVGMIDPKNLNFELERYYRYLGSLTTPPCSENVIWTVSKEMRNVIFAGIMTVTSQQVELLRVDVHDASGTNTRPLQPLNNRLVQLYEPKANQK